MHVYKLTMGISCTRSDWEIVHYDVRMAMFSEAQNKLHWCANISFCKLFNTSL